MSLCSGPVSDREGLAAVLHGTCPSTLYTGFFIISKIISWLEGKDELSTMRSGS
jgi:hypothetical protein